MNFIVYDNTTGLIEYTGFSVIVFTPRTEDQSDSDYAEQCIVERAAALASKESDGFSAIEGKADSRIQKVNLLDQSLVTRLPDAIDYPNVNRELRNALLSSCDWTQVPDTPLSSAVKESWRAYRVALRDLSDTLETFETAELSYSDLPEMPE